MPAKGPASDSETTRTPLGSVVISFRSTGSYHCCVSIDGIVARADSMHTLSSDTADANDLEFLGAYLSSLDAARVAAGRNIARWVKSNGASDCHQKSCS
jgi:hypothetical protein